jgi:hypothetical protein
MTAGVFVGANSFARLSRHVRMNSHLRGQYGRVGTLLLTSLAYLRQLLGHAELAHPAALLIDHDKRGQRDNFAADARGIAIIGRCHAGRSGCAAFICKSR